MPSSVLYYTLPYFILCDVVFFVTKTYNLAYETLLMIVFMFLITTYQTRKLYRKSTIYRNIAYSIYVGIAFYLILKLDDYLSGSKAALLYEFLTPEVLYLLVSFLMLSLVLTIVITRPENWIVGSLLNRYKIQNKSFLFPRITPIPLPFLTSRLTTWLKQDWLLGLHNANELLRYSHQFIPVVKAVNQVLHETPPEHLIFRVSQLATNPADWQLVEYASVSLSKQLQTGGITEDTRLDTPPHAIAAGFWYLHEQEPDNAMDAFETVRSFPYGEEMFILAQTLYQLQKATSYSIFDFDYEYKEEDYDDNNSESHQEARTLEKLQNIAAVKLPIFPPEPLLRPTTWQVLNSLRSVIQDIQFIVGETSESTHNAVLSRAIHKLQGIVDNGDTLPEAERNLVINITFTFKEILEEMI